MNQKDLQIFGHQKHICICGRFQWKMNVRQENWLTNACPNGTKHVCLQLQKPAIIAHRIQTNNALNQRELYGLHINKQTIFISVTSHIKYTQQNTNKKSMSYDFYGKK